MEVVGSNPTPATSLKAWFLIEESGFFHM